MILTFISTLRKWFYSVILTLVFGLLGICSIDLWKGSELSIAPDHDYSKEILDRRDHGKVGEALAICRYVESQPGMPNREAILRLKVEMEEDQASWFGKTKRFAKGFLNGDTMSSEAMTGTLISDFLVIGDIRDLGKQGYKAATGQEVDRMVAGLSALGVATSVASAIPEPGEPAVACADLGISLLKALRKVNALTNRFAAEAFVFAKDAVKTRKLGRFGELAENLKDLAKNAPAGTLGTAMKEVESLDDLKTITKWSQLAPDETIVLLDAGGGSWLKANSVAHKRILGVALRKGPAAMIKARPYIRGTKFLFRGRLQEFRDQLIDAIMAHPTIRRVLIWGGIISCLISVAILMVLASSFFRALQQNLWVNFGSSRSPSI